MGLLCCFGAGVAPEDFAAPTAITAETSSSDDSHMLPTAAQVSQMRRFRQSRGDSREARAIQQASLPAIRGERLEYTRPGRALSQQQSGPRRAISVVGSARESVPSYASPPVVVVTELHSAENNAGSAPESVSEESSSYQEDPRWPAFHPKYVKNFLEHVFSDDAELEQPIGGTSSSEAKVPSGRMVPTAAQVSQMRRFRQARGSSPEARAIQQASLTALRRGQLEYTRPGRALSQQQLGHRRSILVVGLGRESVPSYASLPVVVVTEPRFPAASGSSAAEPEFLPLSPRLLSPEDEETSDSYASQNVEARTDVTVSGYSLNIFQGLGRPYLYEESVTQARDFLTNKLRNQCRCFPGLFVLYSEVANWARILENRRPGLVEKELNLEKRKIRYRIRAFGQNALDFHGASLMAIGKIFLCERGNRLLPCRFSYTLASMNTNCRGPQGVSTTQSMSLYGLRFSRLIDYTPIPLEDPNVELNLSKGDLREVERVRRCVCQVLAGVSSIRYFFLVRKFLWVKQVPGSPNLSFLFVSRMGQYPELFIRFKATRLKVARVGKGGIKDVSFVRRITPDGKIDPLSYVGYKLLRRIPAVKKAGGNLRLMSEVQVNIQLHAEAQKKLKEHGRPETFYGYDLSQNSLPSPNIVTLRGIETQGGIFFPKVLIIARKERFCGITFIEKSCKNFLENGNINHLIFNFLYICMGLVYSVMYLHRAQRVHRDIKPSNLLYMQDGHFALSDLELACKLGEPINHMAGTPSYWDPRLEEEIERRTREKLAPIRWSFSDDMYSLGKSIKKLVAIVRKKLDVRLTDGFDKILKRYEEYVDRAILRSDLTTRDYLEERNCRPSIDDVAISFLRIMDESGIDTPHTQPLREFERQTRSFMQYGARETKDEENSLAEERD